jgi:hypothetical protein
LTRHIGYPELTPYKGGWCGNDIWRGVLPPGQTHAAREMVRKLGDALRREGYFEVDLLHDLDSDELSGSSNLLFRRNSVTGAVEVVSRAGQGMALNKELHSN